MYSARQLIAIPILCFFFVAHGLSSEELLTPSPGHETRAVLDLEEIIRAELALRQGDQVEQVSSANQAVNLKAIRIHGANILSSVELEAAVSKYVGIVMTYEQLYEVAMTVETYYREHNYLARVVLPTQNLNDGVLQLEVMESVVTLAEVNQALNEMPNTRDQIDALNQPHPSQEALTTNSTHGEADVELLLGMYQSRSTNHVVAEVGLVAQLSPVSQESRTRRRREFNSL